MSNAQGELPNTQLIAEHVHADSTAPWGNGLPEVDQLSRFLELPIWKFRWPGMNLGKSDSVPSLTQPTWPVTASRNLSINIPKPNEKGWRRTCKGVSHLKTPMKMYVWPSASLATA